MRTSDADILIVPGLGDSGPEHWQTRWQTRLSTARRVEQADWHRPRCTDWAARIAADVESAARPVVILAHSLGVIAVAHAAATFPAGRVLGALLVAPPSEDAIARIPEIDPDFRPYPRGPLPFPALLVASRTDPYSDYSASDDLAAAWGAALVDAGESGHINADSGHGPWPEGLMRFAGFLRGLPAA